MIWFSVQNLRIKGEANSAEDESKMKNNNNQENDCFLYNISDEQENCFTLPSVKNIVYHFQNDKNNNQNYDTICPPSKMSSEVSSQ